MDWLRKKGLAKAAKKAGRTAAEGLVGIATQTDCGAIVEVNSETDFVAREGEFQNYVRKAAGEPWRKRASWSVCCCRPSTTVRRWPGH